MNVTINKLSTHTHEEKMKMVDLFAGTGAFTLAFENTGLFECVYANDIEKNSKTIYENNFKTKFVLADLNDIDVSSIPKHEILTGWFPCQPFSIAGLQKGFDDKRTNVFWKILEIIEYHKPRVAILENVKNLTSHDNGNTFKTIINNLEKLGYHIKFNILNTCKITKIPQNRERIYIICFKNKEDYDKFDFTFPAVTCDPIISYLNDNTNDNYYYGEKYKVWDTVRNGVTKHISTNTVYQLRRLYIRENKNGVCPTLTANMGGGGHNVPLILDDNGIRKLTPRECFNLQGFPNNYELPDISDTKLYKLAGNAVSPSVVSLIAAKITEIL